VSSFFLIFNIGAYNRGNCRWCGYRLIS